jgi:hypothetical protein
MGGELGFRLGQYRFSHERVYRGAAALRKGNAHWCSYAAGARMAACAHSTATARNRVCGAISSQPAKRR